MQQQAGICLWHGKSQTVGYILMKQNPSFGPQNFAAQLQANQPRKAKKATPVDSHAAEDDQSYAKKKHIVHKPYMHAYCRKPQYLSWMLLASSSQLYRDQPLSLLPLRFNNFGKFLVKKLQHHLSALDHVDDYARLSQVLVKLMGHFVCSVSFTPEQLILEKKKHLFGFNSCVPKNKIL